MLKSEQTRKNIQQGEMFLLLFNTIPSNKIIWAEICYFHRMKYLVLYQSVEDTISFTHHLP